jgi:hypothetical protein
VPKTQSERLADMRWSLLRDLGLLLLTVQVLWTSGQGKEVEVDGKV